MAAVSHLCPPAGIELPRVAQIVVESPEGRRFGSGYLVDQDWVLTAAHVLAPNSGPNSGPDSRPGSARCTVAVCLGMGTPAERRYPVTDRWTGDPRHGDLALLRVENSVALRPVRFGRVGTHGTTVPCAMVGFPAFALRQSGPPIGKGCRDSKHVPGQIHPSSHHREGTLAITVTTALPVGDRVSPWGGMSGAPVFSGGHLVAVVSLRHPCDGPGAVAAARISDWYGPAFAADLPWIRAVTGLPETEHHLVDVADRPALARRELVDAGVAAARRGDYGQALDLLAGYRQGPQECILASEASYYRALALLGGARPAVRARARIQEAERFLSAAVNSYVDSPHAYALWAVVKEDYYLADSVGRISPPVAELRHRAEGISRSHAAEIVSAVPAPQSHTWSFLSRLQRPPE